MFEEECGYPSDWSGGDLPMLIELVASGVRLCIEAGPEEPAQWSKVRLISDMGDFDLGAESLAVVVAGLRRGLLPDFEAVVLRVEDGLDLRWAMSLAELHCTLYVVSDPLRWFWQDVEARWLCSFDLTIGEQDNWIAILDQVL